MNTLSIKKNHFSILQILHTSMSVIFAIMILVSCKKDKTQPNLTDGECSEIIHCSQFTIGGGHYITVDYPTFSVACWNPNNPDEFIYIKANDAINKSIWRYNTNTGIKTLIANGMFFNISNQIQNDWILIGNNDYNIYKIKLDGTGLEQLTLAGTYYRPQFYHEHGKFYVQDLSLPNKIILVQMDGSIIDTVENTQLLKGAFRNQRFLQNNPYDQKIIIRGMNNEIIYQFDYSFQNSIIDTASISGGAAWIDDNNIIYSHQKGYYTLNLNTGAFKKIKNTCPKLFYQMSSGFICNDNNILLNRLTYEQIDECTLKSSQVIVMLDKYGDNEIEVDLSD